MDMTRRMLSIFRKKPSMQLHVRHFAWQTNHRYSISMLFEQIIGLVFVVIVVVSADIYGKFLNVAYLYNLRERRFFPTEEADCMNHQQIFKIFAHSVEFSWLLCLFSGRSKATQNTRKQS